MKLLLFEDAGLAQKLREGGVAVLRTSHAGKELYGIPDTPDNTKLLTARFADHHFWKSGVVCV